LTRKLSKQDLTPRPHHRGGQELVTELSTNPILWNCIAIGEVVDVVRILEVEDMVGEINLQVLVVEARLEIGVKGFHPSLDGFSGRVGGSYMLDR
jgi:hypothetical protein